MRTYNAPNGEVVSLDKASFSIVTTGLLSQWVLSLGPVKKQNLRNQRLYREPSIEVYTGKNFIKKLFWNDPSCLRQDFWGIIKDFFILESMLSKLLGQSF